MKKFLLAFLILALAFFTVPTLFAQEAESVDSRVTVTDIFGIEVGTFIGYTFEDDEISSSQTLGITFGIGDRTEVGMMFIGESGAMFSLIRLSYYLLDFIGLRVYAGSFEGEVASGLGIFSYPIRRSFGDGTLTSALGVGIDYLIPDIESGIQNGILGIGLNVTLSF